MWLIFQFLNIIAEGEEVCKLVKKVDLRLGMCQ